MGNIHLNVRDLEAQKRFWSYLDSTPVKQDRFLQFPGIYLVLRNQEPTGGSVGSVINHFGFHVKNIAEWLPKWRAAGLRMEFGKNPKQVFLIAPDDIKVEILEDASIDTPVAMHHIHLYVPDSREAQNWYVKVFGAVPGQRVEPNNTFDTATIPGAEFAFTKSALQAPSRGRSVDDIGIDVKNIDQFVIRLEAAGVPIEAPVRPGAGDTKIRVTHITDPWGTRIEVTEGFPGSGGTPVASSAER
jgi:catechol 2,3-dioxygenase-like lactoylglutathione lyase family enzyme